MAAQDPPRIRFAALTFDPLIERPIAPGLPAAAASAGDVPDRVVVQFHRPLTADERLALQGEYRLELRDYVPDFAYLERLAPAALARLQRHPLVRATVPYLPAFKIVPGIGEHEFTSEERRAVKGLWLTCVLFRDADPEPVAEALRALGARELTIVDDRKHGVAAKINVIVDSIAIVAAIAALPDVMVIEEMPEPSDDNAGAAGTNQSGIATTRSVWAQGLRGEGQIIGIIDRSPLDIAHCFFQDPVDNTPGVAHRKVLQIRNDSNQPLAGHSTFVAGCAAGDDINNPGAHANRGGAWAARLVSGAGRTSTTAA